MWKWDPNADKAIVARLIKLLPLATLAAILMLSIVAVIAYRFGPVAGLLNRYDLPPALASPGPASVARIFVNNLLVLIFGVAVFWFSSRLRTPDERRFMHPATRRVGEALLALVVAAALSRQGWALAQQLSNLAFLGDISRFKIAISTLPHATVELSAMYLPLVASLRYRAVDRIQTLRAAQICLLIGMGMLAVAAVMEVTLWHEMLRILTPFNSWLTDPPKDFNNY